MTGLFRRRVAPVSVPSIASAESAEAFPPPGSYEFSPKLVTLLDAHGRQAGAIQAIASEVAAHHLKAGHRGLAVCGVSQEVGVSFIAANLAIALSQLGLSILLVDANLRRPGLHKLIRPSAPALGLRDLLTNPDLHVSDIVFPQLLSNLSVVYAGLDESVRHQELLGSDAFRQFTDTVLRDYDCTVIDTSAANQSADARRVATVLGHALVVARGHRTFADDITIFLRECKDDGVSVVGTILNAA